GGIAFGRFWVRRARRLLPALVVCVGVCVLVARLVHPDLLVHLGRQVVGALTFSTNWVEISAGSSYFDQTAPQLFMNVWSLAVEEQFYLVWPFVVAGLVAAALRPRVRVGLTLAVAALSTALMASGFVAGQDPTRVYYGTDTHVMGLMLGAALAFGWASPGHGWLGGERWARWRRHTLVASLAGLGIMTWTLTEADAATFRGGIALASLATTGLIATLLPNLDQPSRWRRLMAAPGLAWVGRRSYGIYLWHWPVLLIVGLDLPTAPGTTDHLLTRAWAVLVTLALCDLSYRFVEAPIRVWGFRAVATMVVRAVFSPFSRVAGVVAGTSAVLLVLAVVVVATAPDETDTAHLLEQNSTYAGGSPASSPSLGGAGRTTPGATVGSPAPNATGAPGPAAPTEPAPSAPSTPSTPSAQTWAMPAGTEIDAFGDSMVVASVHALEYYFPGIRVDGRSNRRWSDGLTEVSSRGPDIRRAVILAYGTNAGVDDTTLGQVLDAVGPHRMVVLVTIYGHASWIDGANATLVRAASTRPNVIVADWHAAISAQPQLLQSDGIHPTITGAHLYSKTIRAAMAQLSESHTGTKVVLKDLPAF
ncbi:MAG: acyltransferase family protein, partial [Lapillicoccus sp.]